ncbi:hypothetical protein DB346_09505 [Verrucomicrobia bacterium LW23]|nr:hypothetical protein DB346_09505 [Verrucomicrobia bacterium LW23]
MKKPIKRKPKDFFGELFSAIIEANPTPLYTVESHSEIVEKWQQVFARKLHAATGEWRHCNFDWHVFCAGYAQALEHQAAVDAYDARRPKAKGYIFSHHDLKKPLCCLARRLPSAAGIEETLTRFSHMADIYVVAHDFSWTYVLTHESYSSMNLGPYFCEASPSIQRKVKLGLI